MLYAAYGSNLNVEQMARRCPGAQIVTSGFIKNYRLMFKGSKTGSYLTIEPAEGYEVPVGVWRVTKEHIQSLNRYEGYPTFYYKKDFNIFCADGKRHRVFAYIMHEESLLGSPTEGYIRGCLAGYRIFEFDEKYLEDALKYSKKRGRGCHV